MKLYKKRIKEEYAIEEMKDDQNSQKPKVQKIYMDLNVVSDEEKYESQFQEETSKDVEVQQHTVNSMHIEEKAQNIHEESKSKISDEFYPLLWMHFVVIMPELKEKKAQEIMELQRNKQLKEGKHDYFFYESVYREIPFNLNVFENFCLKESKLLQLQSGLNLSEKERDTFLDEVAELSDYLDLNKSWEYLINYLANNDSVKNKDFRKEVFNKTFPEFLIFPDVIEGDFSTGRRYNRQKMNGLKNKEILDEETVSSEDELPVKKNHKKTKKNLIDARIVEICQKFRTRNSFKSSNTSTLRKTDNKGCLRVLLVIPPPDTKEYNEIKKEEFGKKLYKTLVAEYPSSENNIILYDSEQTWKEKDKVEIQEKDKNWTIKTIPLKNNYSYGTVIIRRGSAITIADAILKKYAHLLSDSVENDTKAEQNVTRMESVGADFFTPGESTELTSEEDWQIGEDIVISTSAGVKRFGQQMASEAKLVGQQWNKRSGDKQHSNNFLCHSDSEESDVEKQIEKKRPAHWGYSTRKIS